MAMLKTQVEKLKKEFGLSLVDFSRGLREGINPRMQIKGSGRQLYAPDVIELCAAFINDEPKLERRIAEWPKDENDEEKLRKYLDEMIEFIVGDLGMKLGSIDLEVLRWINQK